MALTLEAAINDAQFNSYLDADKYEQCYAMLQPEERHLLAEFLMYESLDPLNGLDYIPDLLFSHLDFSYFNIPDRIKTIGRNAFSQCKELEQLSIPSNVTRIEKFAFADCLKLSDIDFNDSLELIDVGAFMSCENLKVIMLPSKLKLISPQCFMESGIEELFLPNSLEAISANAFNGCKKLNKIYYKGTMEDWKKVKKGISSFRDVPTRLVRCSDGTMRLRG